METINTFIGIVVIVFLIFISIQVHSVEDEVKTMKQSIKSNVCEDIIPYKFRGRQYLICYHPDSTNYTDQERLVINQWKNHQ